MTDDHLIASTHAARFSLSCSLIDNAASVSRRFARVLALEAAAPHQTSSAQPIRLTTKPNWALAPVELLGRCVELRTIVADLGDEIASLGGGDAVLLREVCNLILLAGRHPRPIAPALFRLVDCHVAVSLVARRKDCSPLNAGPLRLSAAVNHECKLRSMVRTAVALSGWSGPSCVMRRVALSAPGYVAPMMPTLVESPPEGEDWLHEIKYDGYRTIVAVDGVDTRAYTRNGHDWSAKYDMIVHEAAGLRCDTAILDGEMIVQNQDGVPTSEPCDRPSRPHRSA